MRERQGSGSGRIWCGGILAVLVGIVVSRLCFPFDVGVYEANNWAPAQLIAAGRNPYHLEHALRPPYTVATYGPLYYLLLGCGLKLFGLQLWFGRLLSVAGAGAALWGVFRLAAGLTGRREAGWLAAGALAAQFPMQFWIAAQRPDLVALGFAISGLAVTFAAVQREARERGSPDQAGRTCVEGIFRRRSRALIDTRPGFQGLTPLATFRSPLRGCEDRQSPDLHHPYPGCEDRQSPDLHRMLPGGGAARLHSPGLVLGWAALLLAAAFHSRQTSLLAAGLAGAWVLAFRGPRECMRFSGLYGVACLVPALLLEWGSAGGYSEQLWRMPATLPRQGDVLASHLTALLQGPQFWVLGATFAAAIARLWGRSRAGEVEVNERRMRVPTLVYAAASLAVALLTSSIPGSNVNYYLEALAALAICLPMALSNRGRITVRAGVAAVGIGAVFTGARVGHGEWLRWQALPYQQAMVRKIESLVTVSEPVYSDYPELVTAAGRTYYFNSTVPYDGRSVRLAEIDDTVFGSGAVRLMVSHSPKVHPSYDRVGMSLPLPRGIFPLHLDLYRDRASRSTDER